MDFIQEKITTIHDFCIDEARLNKLLEDVVRERPVAVVIPMLYQEIHTPSLGNIITQVNRCSYIHEVIIALAAADTAEFAKVKEYFQRLNRPHLLVWNNGPNIQDVLLSLKERGIDLSMFAGKGKDAWIAAGIASLDSYALVLHDADIVSYTSLLPAKLLFPIVEPELDFFFSKGYYARINFDTRNIYGRVFRLFMRPLLDALRVKIHGSDFLEYLCAFKYLLSGEFALTSDLGLNLRVPGDWGLEIGILAEVYRNAASKRICQVDLGYYEHKHKEIGDSSARGLSKMTYDIMRMILRALTEIDSIDISREFLLSLQVLYKRTAQNLVRQYDADAICNDLRYNRHEEETIVDLFSKLVLEAGDSYIHEPTGILLPDWLRAISAMPNIRKKLRAAAELDAEIKP
ncbi:MAG: glucosyl-3-phosphoglycerate synthase [Methanophagales archaeon ANME-1-THS]|nr:MAG: glucosyl-3-phosphoglycerate synthase [Methanophagales archaeon ANME-1-THS]